MKTKPKSKKKTTKRQVLTIRLYGVFDSKNKKMIKVSLDPTEIQMELALSGGLGEHLVECDFDVDLAV